MEKDKLKECSLDELLKIYEELNNYVISLTKEKDNFLEGEKNA